MAKKNDSIKFREIITNIKKGVFNSVYILMGDEAYYLDQITKALESYVIPEADRDFNQMIYYGADSDMVSVISSAQQYPVMAERQLVILKEAQTMDKAKTQLEKLASYVSHPNPSTVLAVVYKGETLPATHQLLKKAKDVKAEVFCSERLKDYELAGPIIDYCASLKVGIDEKAIQMLCDYIGNPLSKLFGEIDKLVVADAPGLGRITPELIENNIGISKDYNTFELQRAISRRDYVKAMTIVDYFERNPKQNPTVLIVSTLFAFFSSLFIGSVTRDKSEASLMAAMDVKNAYRFREYRDALQRYNARQSLAAIHAIRRFDRQSKGIESTQNEYALLKELIFNIFSAQ